MFSKLPSSLELLQALAISCFIFQSCLSLVWDKRGCDFSCSFKSCHRLTSEPLTLSPFPGRLSSVLSNTTHLVLPSRISGADLGIAPHFSHSIKGFLLVWFMVQPLTVFLKEIFVLGSPCSTSVLGGTCCR